MRFEAKCRELEEVKDKASCQATDAETAILLARIADLEQAHVQMFEENTMYAHTEFEFPEHAPDGACLAN